MDLSQVSYEQLTAIEHSLNHCPCEILNFHSPHEAFSILTADVIKGVALQACNRPASPLLTSAATGRHGLP